MGQMAVENLREYSEHLEVGFQYNQQGIELITIHGTNMNRLNINSSKMLIMLINCKVE